MAELSGELVPFKDNFSVVDCHCSVDPRDRLFVCKLDRNDLEDRHLRLLEEVSCLKKLTNAQEDKIKRLATKLMRSGVNSRFCIAAVDVSDEADKICALEAENTKLKAQVCLLRGQMDNQKILGRSQSQGRKNLHGSSSGPITCRSEGSRYSKALACNTLNNARCDDNDLLCKIQELEREKKEMSCRIMELENELSINSSANNREKVAENVELIRVRRAMKQKLEECRETASQNEMLRDENCRLKKLLSEADRDRESAANLLQAEKERAAHLEETMSKVTQTENDLQEKDDALADLKSENSILSEHNRKLLEISSKFAKTEQENAELKRKLADKLSDQQTLKDALSKENANTLALQAANDQLLTKINDLQKNIDVMTIQLMTESANQATKKRSKKSSSSEEKSKVCKKCCCDGSTKSKSSRQDEKGVQTSVNLTDTTVQTEKLPESAVTTGADKNEMYDKNKGKVQTAHNGSSLSRVEMLKLLEQVQISTPLESHNPSRIRHSETTVPRSNLETLLFGDSSL